MMSSAAIKKKPQRADSVVGGEGGDVVEAVVPVERKRWRREREGRRRREVIERVEMMVEEGEQRKRERERVKSLSPWAGFRRQSGTERTHAHTQQRERERERDGPNPNPVHTRVHDTHRTRNQKIIIDSISSILPPFATIFLPYVMPSLATTMVISQ